MIPKKKAIYDENAITTLSDIEHIRQRPSMYIGGLYEAGLYKMDLEPIQNAIDECIAGFGDHFNIIYDSVQNVMTVEDFGRGIPTMRLRDVLSKQRTGSKFNNDYYRHGIGSNGTGAKCTMALSRWLRCEVYREPYIDEKGNKISAKYGMVYFENGNFVREDYKDLPNGIPAGKHRGTTISYRADEKLIKTDRHDIKKIAEYCDNITYQLPNLTINLIVDGKVTSFNHSGGIHEQITDFIKRKSLQCLFDPIRISGNVDATVTEAGFNFDIIFTYGVNNGGDSNIYSTVNANETPEHGQHVSAFRAGASLALTQFINENPDLIQKQYSKLNISGAVISSNLVGIVSVNHDNPLYDTQTKNRLQSVDVQEPIKSTVRNAFVDWLRKNPKIGKKLVNLVIDYAKYEEERKKIKKNIIESKNYASSYGANSIDSSKFTTCRSSDPEEKELFIVEGQSAGGQVSEAQDHAFQALYKLRGKIKNVVGSSLDSLSKECLDLIQLTGVGYPGTKLNYDNLQFHKIVILTDADDDGAHIQTLLLAFYYTFYPKLVQDGVIYVANPPLKKITMTNGQYFFIKTDDEFDWYMHQFILESFDLYSEKSGKKLSKGLFRAFLQSSVGYNLLLDNHGSALAIRPDLLERIVIYIDELSKCTEFNDAKPNKLFKKLTGYDVRHIKDTNMYSFDSGIYHTSLKLDKSFIDQHYNPIIEKLIEIHIYSVYIKGIRSQHEYHGTIYELLTVMNSVLGPKIKIIRMKGLGEMTSADLTETVTNPMTRRLTRITMKDGEKAAKAIKFFMSDSNIRFKRLFYSGSVKFD